MILDIVLFLLTGAVAGSLSGLLGIGGGIIVVPSLMLIFHHLHMGNQYIAHMATGTSLAIMIATTLMASWRHHHYGGIMWSVYRRMLPGIVLGTVAGVVVASYLESHIIRLLFGLFLLFVATRMFILVPPRPERGLPKRWGLSLFGMAVGAKSGLLGVGGGTLTVPFLTRCNVSMRAASGTSTICGFSIAVIGSIGFMIAGLHQANTMAYATGYIYWPAFVTVACGSVVFVPLGARLAQHIRVDIAKRCFAILLLCVGLRMIFL